MLFDITAINNYYTMKDCPDCGSDKVKFVIQETEDIEKSYVYCLKCGKRSFAISRPVNRTRLQDVDKAVEYWNHLRRKQNGKS